MDVLLAGVVGSVDRYYFRELASMPPLGLLYLSAYMKRELGLSVRVIDFQVEPWTEQNFRDMLLRENPRIIGISVYSEASRNAKQLAATVKSVLPSAMVVFGGAYATFATHSDFLSSPAIDVLVRGEGEVTMAQLARHALGVSGAKPLHEIRGATFKRDGEVIANPPRPRIGDLDSLPFPDRQAILPYLREVRYNVPFSLSTSRGCPGDCLFCSSRAFWGNRVRFRSPQNIFEEVLELIECYGMRTFHIVDDTFTARSKSVFTFCHLIREHGLGVRWSCESRADVVSKELLDTMWDAGCVSIQFGIESGVQEVIDAIHKHVTVDQIRNAVRMASDTGMEVNGSFIIGHYSDTLETMKQTIDFVRALKNDYGLIPWMSLNTPFPGTPQYVDHEQLGLEIHTINEHDLSLVQAHVSTRNFSQDDLRNIAAYGWDVLSRGGQWKGHYETRN
jgi:anaerobic magnesium-protoporphyrin IX monomethyl ester cyclase